MATPAVAAASTEAAATGAKRARYPPRPSEDQLAKWPQTLAKPLPATVVARMLLDTNYQPGHRPPRFDPLSGNFVFKEDVRAPRGHLCRRVVDKQGLQADRWHNSGGRAGARDIAVEGGELRVRRRYGVVKSRRSSDAWRFHEHTLVRKVRTAPSAASNPAHTVAASPGTTATEDIAIATLMAEMGKGRPGDESVPAPTTAPPPAKPCEQWVEQRSCAVYHVMPRKAKGRPTREEEWDQAELWAQLAPVLGRKVSDNCTSNAEEATCWLEEPAKASMAQTPPAQPQPQPPSQPQPPPQA